MKHSIHIFSVVLALCIALSLLSCSDDESEPQAESTAAESTEPADESNAAEASEPADEPAAEDTVADAGSETDAATPDSGDRPYVERAPGGSIAVADAYRRECPAVEEPSDHCLVM